MSYMNFILNMMCSPVVLQHIFMLYIRRYQLQVLLRLEVCQLSGMLLNESYSSLLSTQVCILCTYVAVKCCCTIVAAVHSACEIVCCHH